MADVPLRPSLIPGITFEQETEWGKRAAAGVLNTPADIAALYPALSGISEVAGYGSLPGAQATGEFVQSYTDRVYDIMGIEAPETPSEYAMEIANPLAVSKMPIVVLNKLPAALRFIEPMFPMVQGPWSPARAGANVAVPFVAQQGISELIDENESTETIFDSSYYSGAEQTFDADELDLSIEDVGTPQYQALEPIEVDTSDVDLWPVAEVEEGMYLPDINNPDTWEDLDAGYQEQETWRKLVYGGVAGLALVAGAGHAARLIQAKRAKATIDQFNEFTGEAPRDLDPRKPQNISTETLRNRHEPIRSTATAVKTQLIDGMSPVFRNLARVAKIDPAKAETIAAYVQTIGNPSAMAKRIDAFFKVGSLPGSTVRFDTPYATHVSKTLSLSPQEIGSYHTLKQAYRALDDLIVRRNQGQARPLWGTYDEGGLRARINQIEGLFPKVKELNTEYRGFQRQMLNYQEELGMISAAEKVAWIHNRPNYTPLAGKYKPDGLRAFKRMFGDTRAPDPEDSVDIFREAENKMQPGQLKDSFLADLDYFTDVIKYAETNRLRRTVVEALEPLNFDDGAKIIKIKNKKGSKPGLRFRDSTGVEKFAEIRDPALLSALRFRPHIVGGILESASRISMSMYTGKYNPLFAKASLAYEAITGQILLKSGRRLGAIDQALNYLGSDLKLSSFDPTSVAALPFDAAGVLIRSSSLRAANKLRVSSFNNGVLARMLGPRNAEALAKIIQSSYENSAYHLYEQYGGGNAVFIETDTFARPETVGKSIPELAQLHGAILSSSTLGRSYNMTLEAIHNAVRYRHVSANTQRRLMMHTNEDGTQRLPRMSDFGATGRLGNLPVIQFEPVGGVDTMTRLAADTRNLTGDVTRRPGDTGTHFGRGYQRLLAQSPYANHFLQVSAQIARMMKDHYIRMSLSLATFGFGVLALVHKAMEEDPEILNNMTPQQRRTTIPIVFNGKTQWMLNIPPELRLMSGPLIESYLNTNGFLNQQTQNTPFAAPNSLSVEESLARDSSFEAFGKILLEDVVPNPVGPGLNVGSALVTGLAGEPTTLGEITTGRMGRAYHPPRDEYRTLADKNNSVLEDTARVVIEELTGAAGSMLTTTGEGVLTMLKHDQPPMDIMANTAEALTARERNTMAPLLGVDERVNLADPVSDYVRTAQQALKALDPILMRGVMGAGERMSSSRPMNEDPAGFMANLQGTDMAVILPYAKQAQWHLRRMEPKYTVLENEKSQLKRNPYISVAVKQERLNAITLQQRDMTKQMFNVIKTAEDEVTEMLGREFSFATEGTP